MVQERNAAYRGQWIFGAEMGTASAIAAVALERSLNGSTGPIRTVIDSFLGTLAQRGISPEITLFTALVLSGALAGDAIFRVGPAARSARQH